MEDTNGGLLNWMKSPEGQGLLATVFGGLASSQQGTPFNNIGRAGMSGIMGYGNALDRQSATKKDNTLVNVSPGATLYNQKTQKPEYIAPAAPKMDNLDPKIEQFQYAQKLGYPGKFEDFIAINSNIMATAGAPLKDAQVRNIDAENAYNLPRPPSTKQATPMRGQVMGGYKFKGGNPADQNNWEKQ